MTRRKSRPDVGVVRVREPRVDVAGAAFVAQVQALIDEAIRRSGKTRTAVAAAVGTSLPSIARVLRKRNFTVLNAGRMLAAAGFGVRAELVQQGDQDAQVSPRQDPG